MIPRAARSHQSASIATPAVREAEKTNLKRTDLHGDERDHDLLEAFCVPARHGLLEQLEHVLQDLDARVQQVDPLRDFEVAACGVVERLKVRECLREGRRGAPSVVAGHCRS